MNFCVFTRSTTYHNQSGGLETQNKTLCDGLVKKGHKVYIITTALNRDSPKGESPFRESPYYEFTDSPSGVYSSLWFSESIKAYQKITKTEKIDVLISQSSAGLAVFKKYKDVKKIAINHGTSIGEFQTRLKILKNPRNLARLLIKDIPMLITGYIDDYFLFKNSDKIVCVSDIVKDKVTDEFPSFKDKIVVIDNGVDLDKFIDNRLKLNPLQKPNILYIGRIAKEKGLEVLIKSIKNLQLLYKDFNLTIVGGGSDLSSIKSLSRNLKLNNVTFVGEVSNSEAINYYHKADIFVLPSLRQEGFPMVLSEAMASKLAIVASNIGGIPASIINNYNGILVEPGNVNDLTCALQKLLEDVKFRQNLSNNALKMAKEKYSQEVMVKKYLDLIN